MLTEQSALSEARLMLKEWLGNPTRFRSGLNGADFTAELGDLRLIVEIKRSGDATSVGSGIEQLKQYIGPAREKVIPVIVAPKMGDVGQQLCERAGVSWFDLSGNAHIVGPGLRIIVQGKPNKFVRRGRPSSAFAPKSARIARHLLIEPHRAFRQQELARETGLDDGFTSRIVHRLESDHLVARDKEGGLRVPSPDRLLDAWSEVYDFEKHDVIRGHIAARSGEQLLRQLGRDMGKSRSRHAATGLAAAWLHTKFAEFRLVTFFVEKRPSDAFLRSLKFREEPRGANVWLVVPNDEGVFDGVSEQDGVECVHSVQAYVDLRGQPERATDAAAELRPVVLGRSSR